MLVDTSPPRSGEFPPPGTVFSQSFVSPNGAWNILHMIRNSNKMNNKHPQPARAFYEALNENTEPHQCRHRQTSGDAGGRCPIMLKLVNEHRLFGAGEHLSAGPGLWW